MLPPAVGRQLSDQNRRNLNMTKPRAHHAAAYGHEDRTAAPAVDHAHGDKSHQTEQGQADHASQGGHDHGAMIADFRRRFWLALILTMHPRPNRHGAGIGSISVSPDSFIAVKKRVAGAERGR